MFQNIFIFSNLIKLKERMVHLSDLLNVELRNDNLKMFNQAWEETLSGLCNTVAAFRPKTLTPHRAMSYTLAAPGGTTHGHSFLTFS